MYNFPWISLVICSLLASTTAFLIDCVHKRHSETTRLVSYVGSTVNLNCSTTLSPNSSSPSNITWYKFGKPLEDVTFRSMDVVFKYGRHQLWFSEVLLADAGSYECVRVTRGIRPEKKTFSLTVRENKSRLPPKINEKKEYKSTMVGQKIVLVCQTNSRTIPYFAWFYRNSVNSANKLTNLTDIVLKKPQQVFAALEGKNNGVKIYQDLLTVYNTTDQDSGTYLCLVFNKHGKDYKEIHLTVFAEPTTFSKDIDQLHVITKKEISGSIGSKIPMIILIALPAVLFLLSCTAIIRSMERSRQARIARKKLDATANDSKDFNDNQLPTVGIHSNHTYDYCNHNEIRTIPDDVVVDQRSDSELDSTSSASEVEVEGTSSAFANHSNPSRPSSYPMSSTEAPGTTPPLDMSASSVDLDLEWEGMDLCLPEGSELVQMSKEEEV